MSSDAYKLSSIIPRSKESRNPYDGPEDSLARSVSKSRTALQEFDASCLNLSTMLMDFPGLKINVPAANGERRTNPTNEVLNKSDMGKTTFSLVNAFKIPTTAA